MRPRRRTALGIPSTVGALLVSLAACSAGTGGDSSGGPGEEAGAADALVFEHVFGRTALDGPAERVVSLTGPYTDALIAIGADPVGVATDPSTGDLTPWQSDLPDSVEVFDLNPDFSAPVEVLGNLEPDLILAGPFATDQASYEQLSAIAPTVPALSADGFVDTWQEQTLLAGEATGLLPEAEAAVEAAEDRLSEGAERHPGLEGRTYTFLGYLDPANIGVLNNPDDTAAEFFDRLGLEISDGALATPSQGVQGLVSMEEIETVDADVLFVVYLDEGAREDVESHALFQRLDAVRGERYFGATMEQGSALRGPTILTGDWALEQLEAFLSGLEF